MLGGVDLLGYGLAALACSLLLFAGVGLFVGGPDLRLTGEALGLLGALSGVLAAVFVLAAAPALSLLLVGAPQDVVRDFDRARERGGDTLALGLAALACCAGALVGSRMALRLPLQGALLFCFAAVGLAGLVLQFESVAAPLGLGDRAHEYLAIVVRLTVFAVVPWLVAALLAFLGRGASGAS